MHNRAWAGSTDQLPESQNSVAARTEPTTHRHAEVPADTLIGCCTPIQQRLSDERADSSYTRVQRRHRAITRTGHQAIRSTDQWRDAEQVGTNENDELGIVDRESGDWLWHTDYPAYPMARAGGVVLALSGDGQTNTIQGLHASTDELLWERPNLWLMCPCLSDGSTLAGQAYQVTADSSMSADQTSIVGLDVSSGEQIWSIPRPEIMRAMFTDGRHLVVASAWELSGWRLG